MKHHPDISKSKSNGDMFKQITAAHSVLSDDKHRKKYDFELEQTKKFGFRARNGGGSQGTNPFDPRTRGSGGMRLKPVNLLFGATFALATVITMRTVFGEDKSKQKNSQLGKKALVEAWKDSDGLWKQPQPWSKAYRNLNPQIHLVPRDEVQKSYR